MTNDRCWAPQQPHCKTTTTRSSEFRVLRNLALTVSRWSPLCGTAERWKPCPGEFNSCRLPKNKKCPICPTLSYLFFIFPFSRLERHLERKAWVASFGLPKMTPQVKNNKLSKMIKKSPKIICSPCLRARPVWAHTSGLDVYQLGFSITLSPIFIGETHHISTLKNKRGCSAVLVGCWFDMKITPSLRWDQSPPLRSPSLRKSYEALDIFHTALGGVLS